MAKLLKKTMKAVNNQASSFAGKGGGGGGDAMARKGFTPYTPGEVTTTSDAGTRSRQPGRLGTILDDPLGDGGGQVAARRRRAGTGG